MLYIGADHRGFELKELLKKYLKSKGVPFEDAGNDHLDVEDDYVDFAVKVAGRVSKDPTTMGILVCGSGVGVDIVANKFKGVRSALVFDITRAKQSREHEAANVLCLGSDVTEEQTAIQIVDTFLNTPFSNEDRHIRRVAKIEDIEKNH